MNRTITLIILIINLFECNSQVKTRITNFDKLSILNEQIENNLTTEKTYISLDSLKNVIDGADSEFYIEIYKDAIINDTQTLMNFLKLYDKKVDENVIEFFEHDDEISSNIRKKLNSIKNNTVENIHPNGYWKQNCDKSLAFVCIKGEMAIITVNTNQIYIQARIKKISQNEYDLTYFKTLDLGKGGMELEWNNFSRYKIIATINFTNAKEIEFKWLGFFNDKSKKRNWINESTFSSKGNKNVILKRCFEVNVINDPDGYTNLRKHQNTSSEILQRIISGSEIEVLDNSGNWWLVETGEGKRGYVHKTRIKAE